MFFFFKMKAQEISRFFFLAEKKKPFNQIFENFVIVMIIDLIIVTDWMTFDTLFVSCLYSATVRHI